MTNQMTAPKKRISEMIKETPISVYIDRFWSKVDRSGDCWVWTGSRTHSGYGEFHNGYGRSRVASRFSFEIANGPIPEGMIICHKCDNPPCVNPDHLFLGTHKDNVLDMVSKKRYNSKALSIGCFKMLKKRVTSKGSKHYLSKITEEQARFIREYSRHKGSGLELAKMFSVSPAVISKVRNRKLWIHA